MSQDSLHQNGRNGPADWKEIISASGGGIVSSCCRGALARPSSQNLVALACCGNHIGHAPTYLVLTVTARTSPNSPRPTKTPTWESSRLQIGRPDCCGILNKYEHLELRIPTIFNMLITVKISPSIKEILAPTRADRGYRAFSLPD
jgi:hypothetical protein